MHKLEIHTEQHSQMIDITERVQGLLRKEKIMNGLAIIYSVHTTAGITINENADPDVQHDALMRLDEIYPWEHPRDRHMEGNTASHLKAITTGSSQTVIIEEGCLLLGRWQGIYFCEFDGPRHRTCMVKFVNENNV
jgi:secondary thiamine-phosphate synthase enzyme